MAALFPPTKRQQWNVNLSWQPIPVHTEPQDQDYRLAAKKQCDHFDYLISQYLNTTAYTGLFEKHQSLIRYLEINSGETFASLREIGLLYDILYTEQVKGYWYGIEPYFSTDVCSGE